MAFDCLLRVPVCPGEKHAFEIAGDTYRSMGMSASPAVGEVSLEYKINGNGNSWGAMAGVSAYPKITEKIAVVPALELGVIGVP